MAPPPPAPSLTRGVSLALRGLRLALGSAEVRRTYLRLALALVLTALVLSAALVGLAWWLIPVSPDMAWMAWLRNAALLLAATVVALIAAPMLALFVVNVAFPFLADAVFMAGARAADPALAARLEKPADVGLMASISGSVRRLFAFVGVTLALTALSFVPVIGAVLGPVLELWFAARTLAWELLDPYFERVGSGYDAQRPIVAQRRATLVGYGLPWTFLMALPVFGPLLFGLAQAGVAALVVEDIEASQPVR